MPVKLKQQVEINGTRYSVTKLAGKEVRLECDGACRPSSTGAPPRSSAARMRRSRPAAGAGEGGGVVSVGHSDGDPYMLISDTPLKQLELGRVVVTRACLDRLRIGESPISSFKRAIWRPFSASRRGRLGCRERSLGQRRGAGGRLTHPSPCTTVRG